MGIARQPRNVDNPFARCQLPTRAARPDGAFPPAVLKRVGATAPTRNRRLRRSETPCKVRGMKRRESRCSSCEMTDLEVDEKEVRCFLNRYAGSSDRYTSEEVFSEVMDNEIGAVFGHDILTGLKMAARAAAATGEA